ncbi:MAG: hypothetical protein JSR91_27045 [Proteobacteria bacterium]|nr:hypothetical protein [Pseudomonadota bacterium]
MGLATSIVVLLLVFSIPGSNGVATAQKIDFKTQVACESFREKVMHAWDGSFDKQRNSSKPTAWGICVEKPL